MYLYYTFVLQTWVAPSECLLIIELILLCGILTTTDTSKQTTRKVLECSRNTCLERSTDKQVHWSQVKMSWTCMVNCQKAQSFTSTDECMEMLYRLRDTDNGTTVHIVCLQMIANCKLHYTTLTRIGKVASSNPNSTIGNKGEGIWPSHFLFRCCIKNPLQIFI